MNQRAGAVMLLMAMASLPVQSEDIVRRQLGDFPIASSVRVPPGAEIVFLSGTLADVVKMNVFLVGDPAKGGQMDFEGLMKAYGRYFGEASKGRLPARTTVQVAALPLPGALVEIEVVAARVP